MHPQSYARDYKSPAYKRMALYFLSFAAGLAALAAYILFSKATVVVLATRQPVNVDFTVDVSRSPVDGEVLGDVIEQTSAATQTFPTTEALNADAPAEGKVKITSSLGRPQTLIATTRLLTDDGRLYRIKTRVTVPAHGSVEAAAFADAPGKAGEMATGSFTIPGLTADLQKLFAVEVSEPFVGGMRNVKLVTQADVDAAAKTMGEKLRAELAQKLAVAAIGGGKPLASVLSFEVMQPSPDPAVGQESDQFSLTVSVAGRSVRYDDTILRTLVEAKLRADVPKEREFLYVKEDALTVTVEKADAQERRARLKVSAVGDAALSTSAPELKKAKLTGISAESARKYLESIDGVSSASVSVRPFWVGRMPNRAANIDLEVR